MSGPSHSFLNCLKEYITTESPADALWQICGFGVSPGKLETPADHCLVAALSDKGDASSGLA